MASQKTREPNFSTDEKALLLELVRSKPVIECKKTDKYSAVSKERAWELLSVEFNAAGIGCQRSMKSLKKRWFNMKDRAKADATERRRELRKTGGGTMEHQSDPLSDIVACKSKR